MALLVNLLIVAWLGLLPDGPVVQTTVVVPDGGTVLLGGLKSRPAQSPATHTMVVVPDGGTVLLGGLKLSSRSIVQPTVVVPDGGTVLLGGLKRLR
jgi:type II secretory pathway component GspD/PulD (secretin)